MRRLLPKKAVCEAIGFSRAWLDRKVRAGDFPPPVKVFGQIRWDSEQVDAWIRDRIEQEQVSA